MQWDNLAKLGVTIRPLREKPPIGGKPSPFSASLSNTIETLAAELRHLDAKNIVLEVDVEDRHIRIDGLPRADARPSHPGVALFFDSKYGPLRYATAEFTSAYWRNGEDWHANLRAIALGMEALRKVDRYGVSRRGEQYAGYRALPVSTDPADAIQTRDQAKAVLEQYGGDWRKAVKDTHPDAGGDPDEYRKVIRAKELLGV